MARPAQTELAVLGALSTGPMSGYELRRAITEVLGHFWHESYGQIYPCLTTLERAGAVRRTGPGPHVRHGLRRSRRPGEDRLRALLAEPHHAPPARNGLLLRLFFGSHLAAGGPGALLDAGRGCRASAASTSTPQLRAPALDDDRAASRPCATITLSFGEHLARAQLAWAARVPRDPGSRRRRGSAPCPRVTPSTAPPTASTRRCAARVVERAELRWPSVPDVDLAGSRTLEVVARGKHLLHRFDTGATLHTHLRMEGQWRVEHPGPPHRAGPAPRRTCGRRSSPPAGRRWGCGSGMLDLVPTAREFDLVGHLGPDVLGPDWDPAVAAARLTASEGFVGDALLDQRVLAGVGTFWASEILFLERRAALDPGPRPRPRPRRARIARPAAPAHGPRAAHRLAGEHRHPAIR